MKKPTLNNLQMGMLTERIVESKFIEKGFNTLLPRIPSGKVDLLVEKNNKFNRLQIKGSYYVEKSDCYRTSLLGAGHKRYNLNEFDYFVIHIFEHNSLYIIPTKYAATAALTLFPHRQKGESKYATRTNKLDYNIFLNNFDL